VALATRNLYLVLKARDEASRVVRGFGRELSRQGAIAQAEALRQRASMISLAAAQASLGRQQQVNSLRQRAALAAEAAAFLRSKGATQRDIDQKVLAARSYRRQAEELERLNNMENKHAQLSAQRLRTQAAMLERTRRQAVRLSNALHTVSATWVTVGSGIAIGSAAGLVFLTSSVRVARDYERQVRLTKTQVDGFAASLEQISEVGLKVARNIAVPFEQIQPALYDILSSTNANLKQATTLLEGFSKTAVAGQVTLQEASRGTIPILNAFNIPLERVNEVLDIQFQLVRKGVGTYGEFARVFGRVVPSATRAGQSFQVVAAMLAFMTRNGLSAAMASTSAARALDALSHPKSVAAMEKMGVTVRDAKGHFLGLDKILVGLREKLLKLPVKERVGALIDVFKGAGGTIQARRFLEQVLLRPGELEEFIGFLGDMNTASGAFGQAYGEMAGSVAAQSEILRNRWMILQEAIGKAVTPAFIVIISFLSKMLDKFNQLSPATKKFIAVGILVASIFGILAGGAVILLGVLAGITAAITAAGTGFFVLTGIVAATVLGFAALGAGIYNAWQRSVGFRSLLEDLIDAGKRLYYEALLPAAQGIRQAWDQYMGPALGKLFDAIETHILPVVRALTHTFIQNFLPAAKEVANWLKTILAAAFKFVATMIQTVLIPAFKIAQKFYLDHKETIDQVIAVLVVVGKWFLKIAAIVGVVLLAAFVGPIIAAIIAFVASIAGIVVAIIKVIEFIKAIINWFRNLGNSSSLVGQTIRNSFQLVIAFMKSVPGRIKDALGNLGTLLLDAGRNLIQGLINGVQQKVGGLLSKIGEIAGKIRGAFPFSPAKWGPLSGSGDLFHAGRKMVERLAKGMSSVDNQLALAGGGVAGSARSGLIDAPTGGSSRTVNQTINVNHVGQDAKTMAAEIGFRLSGRM
jgi:TP901 family phage tail tape measure protein